MSEQTIWKRLGLPEDATAEEVERACSLQIPFWAEVRLYFDLVDLLRAYGGLENDAGRREAWRRMCIPAYCSRYIDCVGQGPDVDTCPLMAEEGGEDE